MVNVLVLEEDIDDREGSAHYTSKYAEDSERDDLE